MHCKSTLDLKHLFTDLNHKQNYHSLMIPTHVFIFFQIYDYVYHPSITNVRCTRLNSVMNDMNLNDVKIRIIYNHSKLRCKDVINYLNSYVFFF